MFPFKKVIISFFFLLKRKPIYMYFKGKEQEIFFQKDSFECDFVLRKNFEIESAYQVSVSLQDKKTSERELKGLLHVLHEQNLQKGVILTLEEEEELSVEGKQILITPVWKFLLDL